MIINIEMRDIDERITWLAKFPEGANIIEQLWKINDYGQVLIMSPECQKDKRACQRSKAILWSRLSLSRMGFQCPCRCICSEPELMHLLQHNSQEILRKKQRHNEPKGWVLLAETCLGQITSSYSNLDQISSSESWSSTNFKISINIKLHNLYKTSASPQNLSFKILTKSSFRISTKI